MLPSEMIRIIFLPLIAASGVYGLLSLFCIVEFFRAQTRKGAPPPTVPISIIKPLKGFDPEMRENILSFCVQDYPEYEVLLGFTAPDDPAIAVAQEIAASHPRCNARVVISDKNLGTNKKVSNLQGLLEAARYPLLAISDSDMRVGSDYLKSIVKEYYQGKNIGLVTSLYKITNPPTIGAAFESLTIALDFIPSVLVAGRTEGVTFGLGASMLLSKAALEEIGGFAAIADYLADDYQIGYRLSQRGYGITLSGYVMEDIAGAMSVREYLAHQVRWARTYRACRPKGFLGYGITYLLPLSLLFFIAEGPTTLALAVLAAAFALRVSQAFVLYGKVIRSRVWLSRLALLPLKDMLSFGIWVWSLLGKDVFWRGERYRISAGGKIGKKMV